MGFFDKLFEKKVCSACGAEIGLLGNRKLEDGNLCKKCTEKLSPWFQDRRESTVAEIQAQLAYREENLRQLQNFKTSRVLGGDYKMYIEEIDGFPPRFYVSNSRQPLEENPDIILFVDEIHNIMGAGAAEGAIDAANIFKPALGRGELQILGATTREEYRKYIEKDPALERRFRPVMVEEPDEAATMAILRGLKPGLERHHKLRITEEALQEALRLSQRYLSDLYLPDKAIDLLDEGAAHARMEELWGNRHGERTELEKELRSAVRPRPDPW